MTRIALTACIVGLLLPAGASGGASRPASTCVGNETKVNGVTIRIYCGHAKATVHLGTRTLTFKEGRCRETGPLLSVNIGRTTLGTTKAKYLYFGIQVSAPQGGTFHNAAITFQYPGASAILYQSTLKLSANTHGGTFNGWTP